MDLRQVMQSLTDEREKELDPATRLTRFFAVGRRAAALMRELGHTVLTEAQASDVPPRGGGVVYYEVS